MNISMHKLNFPVCDKCDCIDGFSANPVLCPNLVAECIASSQVSAAQHRVIDAAICTPARARELSAFIGYDSEVAEALCSLADQIEALIAPIAQPKDKP